MGSIRLVAQRMCVLCDRSSTCHDRMLKGGRGPSRSKVAPGLLAHLCPLGVIYRETGHTHVCMNSKGLALHTKEFLQLDSDTRTS